MSNAKIARPISLNGSMTMNDSLHHITRATLLSLVTTS